MAIFTQAGTNQGVALIRDNYVDPFTDAVYRNHQLLGLTVGGQKVFPERASGGGNGVPFKVITAGNTSTEIFTEGQPQPTAVAQTWVTAEVTWTYIRAMIQVTGHAVDAMKSNYVDGIAEEMEKTILDISDLQNTTAMSAANSGLQVAIDSTSTYAGLARGSLANWESSETAVSGALAYTDLVDLHETIRNADKGGVVGLWLVPPNQLSNYAYLVGSPNVQNSSFNVQMGGGQGMDLGYNVNAMGLMGAPVVEIGDLTSTVWLAMDIRPGNFRLVIHRDMGVKEMAPIADSDVYQISTAYALPCYNPKLHGKLTGVTA